MGTARGQICLGLIQVYRGLGGGWQIKCSPPPDKRGILSPPPAAVADGKPINGSSSASTGARFQPGHHQAALGVAASSAASQ